MDPFLEFLAARIKELGLLQKQLMSAIVERCPSANSGTVESKLSKLLNGNEEGDRYFFGETNPFVTEALAEALRLSLDELMERRRAAREMIVLLVAADVSNEATAFLRQQQTPRYRVVEARPAHREELRDAARENRAWLVLANESEVAFFDGADVRWTLLQRVRRGWQLGKLPDLVPIPPPPPPPEWAENGEPLCPMTQAQVTAFHTKAPSHVEQHVTRTFDAALEREQLPALRIKDAIQLYRSTSAITFVHDETHTRDFGKWDPVSQVVSKNTLVWVDGRQVYALGPHAGEVEQIVRPHPVLAPRKLSQNPWDVDTTGLPGWLKGVVNTWASSEQAIRLQKLTEASASPQHAADLEPTQQELVADLAARAMPTAGCVFLFQRLLVADWVLPVEANEILFAGIADMGGGHFMELRVASLPGDKHDLRETKPEPHRSSSSPNWFTLHGGDVLVVLLTSFNDGLEGYRPRARRQRVAAAEALADYWSSAD